MLTILLVVVVLALVFDYINGMHDAANAIATGISTHAIPPRVAVIGAALFNFLGAFLSTAVAKTIGGDIADASVLVPSTIAAALLAAIIWNILTWWKGIPSSSSHALIGGIIGAAIATSGFEALKMGGVVRIIKALIFSPLIGFCIGFLVMTAIYWIFRNAAPSKLNRRFRVTQWFSASFLALSHGSNDAQKSMGIITMALVAYTAATQISPDSFLYMDGGNIHVPLWVKLSCALAMAVGTSMGGWRIIKTMGSKMIKLTPPSGCAAEISSSIVILSASHVGLPVSTTHVISGSIMGVGTTRGVRAVHWDVVGKMLSAWFLTIPITAVIAFALEWLFLYLQSP